jgi:parvulin-like peptidyl-prolyl isomerase
MKPCLCLAALLVSGLCAQPPATPSVTMEVALSPEAVVATIGGKNVTYGELSALLKALPPQLAQQALADRAKFVEQYGLLRRLVELAEQEKLHEKSPYKEGIAYNRMQLLYEALINERLSQLAVTPEDAKKYYEASQDRFTQARVRVIYLSFVASPPPQTDPAAKKVLTEVAAKAKAEDLLKQLRAGADFVALVKEHSEDATSAAKGGEFGSIRRSDKIPEEIKKVIFALKPGEVGGPVRQPNGFYLFRLDELSTQSLEEVRDTLQKEIRSSRLTEWMEEQKKGLQLKVLAPEFFSPKKFDLAVPPPPKP